MIDCPPRWGFKGRRVVPCPSENFAYVKLAKCKMMLATFDARFDLNILPEIANFKVIVLILILQFLFFVTTF